jgi:hypothetical protein
MNMLNLRPEEFVTNRRLYHLEIERIQATGPARYRVTLEGEVLIDRCRDPEFDACRKLQALGMTGTIETWMKGATAPGFRLDIELGSHAATHESATRSPRLGKWSPFVRDGTEGEE